MSIIYDVVAVRHEAAKRAGKQDYILFYDEDKEKAIKAMHDYDSQHGFAIDTPDGTMTIATLILRERTATGKIISETPYHELFDVFGKRK